MSIEFEFKMNKKILMVNNRYIKFKGEIL